MDVLKVFLGTYGVFLLQNGIFSGWMLKGAPFNIFPLGMTFYIMKKEKKISPAVVGLFLGFFCDIFYSERLGFYMLLWYLIGGIGTKLFNYLNSRSFLSAGILATVLSFCFRLFSGLGYYLLGAKFTSGFVLNNTFHESIIVTGLIAALCYLFAPKLQGVWKVRKKSGKA